MKTMRTRIALQSPSCKIDRLHVFRFTGAFGVGTPLGAASVQHR